MDRVSVVVVFAAGVAACASIAGLEDPDPVVAVDTTVDGGPGLVDSGGDTDDIEVTPSEIDFNEVACGTESANVPTFLFHNKGAKPVHYVVQVPDGSAFEVRGPAPLTGDLGPGATATFSAVVKPKALGDNSTEITVTTANAVAQVTLKAKGTGGKLEVLPTIADFGQVRYQNDSTLDIAFKNTGTSAISIPIIDGANADFDVTWLNKPTALSLLPNESAPVTVKLKMGAVDTMPSTTLVPKVDGVLCGSIPSVPVKGNRVNQDITVSTADFGKLDCNTSPALQRDVIISNYTSSAFAYTVALTAMASSPFVIANPGPGTVAAGSTTTPSTAKVTVGVKPVGANIGPRTDTLDIVITGGTSPGSRKATLSADVHGIVLTVNPTSLAFGYKQTKTFTLTNAGNENYTTSYTYTRDPNTSQSSAWSHQWPSGVTAGTAQTLSLYFNPGYCGYYAGTYAFPDANNVPICNGVPTLHVTGDPGCR